MKFLKRYGLKLFKTVSLALTENQDDRPSFSYLLDYLS